MGRDFLSQLPGRAANVGGLGLDMLALVEAAQSPATFQAYLQNQALARGDPALRGELERSPFLAGALGGLPVHSQPVPPNPAEIAQLGQLPVPARIGAYGELAQAPGRPRRLAPNLPPLSAASRAQEALAGAEARLTEANPEAVARKKLGLGPSTAEVMSEIPLLQALKQAAPGMDFSIDKEGHLALKTSTRQTQPLEFPSQEEATAAGSAAGLIPVPTNRGTFVLRKGREPTAADRPVKPTFRDVVALRAAGIDPATGGKLPPLQRLAGKRQERALERARFGGAEATAAGGLAGRPLQQTTQRTLTEVATIQTMTAQLRELLKDPTVRGNRGVLEGRLRQLSFSTGISQGPEEDAYQALRAFVQVMGVSPFLRGTRRLEWVQMVQAHLPLPGDTAELIDQKLNNLDYWTSTFSNILATLATTPGAQVPAALERLRPQSFLAQAPGYAGGSKLPPTTPGGGAILDMQVQ